MNTLLITLLVIVIVCFAFCVGYIVGSKAIGYKQVTAPKTEEKTVVAPVAKSKMEVEAEIAKAKKADASMYHFRNLLNYNGKPQNPYDEVE